MKILGSDYDGTFAEGGIDAEKLAAVAAWRASGHKFGIVSGRGGDFLPILRARHPDLALDFFAACNGAYITDGDGAVIFEAPCRAVPALELGEALYDISTVVSVKVGEHCLYALKEGDALPEWVVAEEKVPFSSLAALEYFHCFSVCFPSVTEALAAAEGIRKAFGDRLCTLPNGIWLDIVDPHINKAEGLLRVAEHFGAARADVIAVGDNANDMDMIRAFRSYAMANGVEALRAAAGAVVGSVCEVIKLEL